MLVDFARCAHLQHPALAHDGDARGHGHGFFLIVGDHHAGHTHSLDDIDQFKLRLLSQLFVQGTQGLVQQQQLRTLGQAAGQRHALLLAARELVRFAFGKRSELHQAQHTLDAFTDLGFGQAFTPQSKRNVVPHTQVRKQCIRLKHHVDGPLVGRHRGDVHAIEKHGAGAGRFKAGEHAQER